MLVGGAIARWAHCNGWNGMKLNSNQPIGVYVYTVRAVTLNEKEYTMKGDITLVR